MNRNEREFPTDPSPERFTIRPEQIVALMSLFGRALTRSEVDSRDVDFLIARDDVFASELEAILNYLTNHGQQVMFLECLRTKIDTTSSLTDLCRAANIFSWPAAPTTIISDPPIPAMEEFYLVTFKRDLWAESARALLHHIGYRSATIREALSLMVQDAELMTRYPHVVLYAPGSAFDATSLPLFQRQGSGNVGFSLRHEANGPLSLDYKEWYTIITKQLDKEVRQSF